MDEEHVFDLLPCFVLGILDESEKKIVSEHLAACDICRKELESYIETPSHLGMAVPRLTPSATLKARVLCRVKDAAGENSSMDGESPQKP